MLEITDSYKYLGVICNKIQRWNGNVFREMYKYSADKDLKACFSCFKKKSKIWKVTLNISFHLFDSNMAPILEYACDVWMDSSYNEVLKIIQLRFLTRDKIDASA